MTTIEKKKMESLGIVVIGLPLAILVIGAILLVGA